jgi:DNA-binding MarR family transcriptional regulator
MPAKTSKQSEIQKPDNPDFAALLAMSLHILTDNTRARLHNAGFTDIKKPYGFIFRAIAKDGASINELAALLEVSKQAASKIVDDMTTAGYVTRDEHETDRRSKIVRLSERGRQAMQAARKANQDLETKLEKRVGKTNLEAMRSVLSTFASEGDPTLYKQRRARPIW